MYHTSAEPVKGGGNLDLPAFGSLRDFDAEEALVPHGKRCAARRAGEQRGCNRTTCGILSGSLGQTPQVFENPGGGGPSAAIRTVTTDNGCEFPGQRRLDGALGAEVYYTRAYASYEKGSVENCNRLVRRWHPKGTDFNRTSRREIRDLEDWINTIPRESLNGETAYAYDSCLAKVA